MISRKARSAILRSHTTGRDLAVVDEVVERELISSGFMTYGPKPLLKLTYDGKRYAQNAKRARP